MQNGRKAVWSIPCVSVGLFPSLKQNFMTYRSSKVSSRPDCIFEIPQLWQSGFSRMYSNCCCSCSFEPENIGQSSHKMYSNNIVNFQESTTTLNACTIKSLENYWRHHVSDFKRGQIVGARMAGASATKTAELFRVSRSSASNVMTLFKKGKTTSLKLWKKVKAVIQESDGPLGGLLGRITRMQLRKLLLSLMTISGIHFPHKKKKLHKAGFYGRDAIRKPY